LYYNNYTPA